MDYEKIVLIGGFIWLSINSLSTLANNRQSRKVSKLDEQIKLEQLRNLKKNQTSQPPTKRKKKGSR